MKQFAVFDGKHHKIMLVDLERRKIGNRNVESAFYEKGLYEDEVELELNSKIEKPGMKVFDKAYNSDGFLVLTRRELETMKKYLLVQQYRNPSNISHYSPNWKGDIMGINKQFKDDTEATRYVSEEIHKICNTTWRQLLKTDDRELFLNVNEIRQTMTLFVRSRSLEFVLNDLGHVTERRSYRLRDDGIARTYLEYELGCEISDELFEKWNKNHQFFDNFTFYPISPHMGVITLSSAWSQLVRAKNPFFFPGDDKRNPMKCYCDPSFFDYVETEVGLSSYFIETYFVPGIPTYQSNRMRKVNNRTLEQRIQTCSSPNDKYHYPIVDLDIDATQYLNLLTINEAKRYFAFGSMADGKLSISNYDDFSLDDPSAKNDLSWLDWDSDWNRPLD